MKRKKLTKLSDPIRRPADLMLWHWPARALLALCLCGATSAQALDFWETTPVDLTTSENLIPLVDCSAPPSAATCENAVWVSECETNYGSNDPNDAVNNPCLTPQAPSGKSFAEQAQEASPSSAATSESVFVPNGSLQSTTPPAGITAPATDKFTAALPSPSRDVLAGYFGNVSLENSNAATATSWANQELIAQYKAWSTPNLNPASYRRYTNTTENFNLINSCENYVYRSFMDVEVWIDALDACGSGKSVRGGGVTDPDQARCVVNTSLSGYTATGSGTPPAIFRRRPQNVDGAYIYDPSDPDNHITKLIAAGAIDQVEADPFDDSWQITNTPKNAFYAGTEYLITPAIFNSMIAQGIDAQDMVNELNRGDDLYESGKGVPTSNGGYYLDAQQKLHQGFYDEWDFHNFMNQATQATTEGQSREFRRRNDQVVQAWGQLADDMKCLFADGADIPPGGCNGSNIPNAIGKINPGDTQIYENDPLQMNAILSAIAPSQVASPPSLFGEVGFGNNLQQAQYTAAQIASLNIISGAQNVQKSSHVPGALSVDATTKSLLLSALDLPPALLARAPAAVVEDLEVTEARVADISNAQTVMLLNNLGNIGLGLGGIGQPPALTNSGGQTLTGGSTSAPSVPVGGGNGLALANALPIRGGGNNLANYVQTYTPSAGGLSMPTQFMVDRAWTINPPRWTTSNGQPILNCGTREGDIGTRGAILQVDSMFHTEMMWPALCQITNLLIAEWERVELGNPSCLDKTTVACDWVPQDFIDRFVTENISYAAAAKEVEYSYCKRWTGGGQITSTATDSKGNLTVGVAPINDYDLDRFRSFLDVREAAFEKEFATVPVHASDVFGKIKTDGNGLGNSEFGGGYNYTLGWTAQVYRDPTPSSPTYQQICRLGGQMQAGFNAYAILFGDNIPIIDADVTINANENDDGKANGWADLNIATFEVFNAGDKDNPIDLTASYEPFNKFDSEKPQFVEAPFQVGWITVTVRAGILFDYGAKLTLTSKVPQHTCNPKNPDAWEAKAVFQPEANLGVWVDADATLAGIFGVGFEVNLVLLGLGLPLNVDVALGIDPNNGLNAINFDAELDLTLNTLSGELDFYIIAFWAKVASFKVVSWNGFTAKFPIFRTRTVSLDLGELPQGSVSPPGGTDASEDI